MISSLALATFLVCSSHVWLVATAVGSNREGHVSSESAVGLVVEAEERRWRKKAERKSSEATQKAGTGSLSLNEKNFF